MSDASQPRVLALESSCDETAAAVVAGSTILSSVVSSQIEVHQPFGGVVPELASREHLAQVVPVVEAALERASISWVGELDAVAVTEGPGLVGALLVGVQVARGLASAAGLPVFGVHHLEGHVFSAGLGDDERPARALEPHVALVVSGGHTELVAVRGLGRYEILGATRDDAAGEAYDKVSKALGLGYPGGPVIDRFAAGGDPAAHAFPRAMLDGGLEFSFSGLKTAILVHLERQGEPDTRQGLADLCASFQAAVVDVLVSKACLALRRTAADRLHAVGGVAANRGLRAALAETARREMFTFEVPPLRYCGDNAAMIGAAAAARIAAGYSAGVEVHASRTLEESKVLRL